MSEIKTAAERMPTKGCTAGVVVFQRDELRSALVKAEQDRDWLATQKLGDQEAYVAMRDQRDAITLQAKLLKQEARTYKSIIQECYQACTGATGEPGDWNGALPVKAVVAERNALRTELDDYDKECSQVIANFQKSDAELRAKLKALEAEKESIMEELQISELGNEVKANKLAALEGQEPVIKLHKKELGPGFVPRYAAAPVPEGWQPIETAPNRIKDHEIAKAVNVLRDVAIEFHDSQQLRERIAQIVRELARS